LIAVGIEEERGPTRGILLRCQLTAVVKSPARDGAAVDLARL
jgi:hypothetical protein